MTTVVTRAAKGSRLTWGEVDANFTNLNADKVETINPTSSGTLTHSGAIVLSGSGKRITGDFSNVTAANRLMFQTSTVDSVTSVGAIPNGTGAFSQFDAYSFNDPSNSSIARLRCAATDVQIISGANGTGTFLPMTFYTGGSERMRVDTAGNVLVTSPAGLGYGTGAGGTVTQAISKATAVTLNKPTGQITMHNAALAANTVVTFVLNNNLIADGDTLTVNVRSGASDSSAYVIWTAVAATGAVNVYVWNRSGTSYSDALVLKFNLHKGALT